jgi:hypothetical protein
VLIVHAASPAAARFYATLGFDAFPTDPLHLGLLLKTSAGATTRRPIAPNLGDRRPPRPTRPAAAISPWVDRQNVVAEVAGSLGLEAEPSPEARATRPPRGRVASAECSAMTRVARSA